MGIDTMNHSLSLRPRRSWVERAFLAGAFATCLAFPGVVSAQNNEVPTVEEFKTLLGNLPRAAVTHGGTAFTYGFELEGKGAGFTAISRPKDAAVDARWDAMSSGDKRAYYERVVGENHSSVKQHFEVDTAKHPWLDPYWYVEGTGNWEIHSRVMKGVGEITDAMRTAKELTGSSGKGFHLHMRDNKPDWTRLDARGGEFADWIERSSNWVYLKRVERLRTDLSLKSWSNARMSEGDLSNAESLRSTGRATVRIASVNRGGGEEFIDLEIRGFTKFIDDVETLAKIYTNGLKEGNFGSWRLADNPMPGGGQGSQPESVDFAKRVTDYLAAKGEPAPSAERLEILRGLQGPWADRAGGSSRAYSSGVSTPLMPWASDMAFSEATRTKVAGKQEAFLKWLNEYAGRVEAGEFGNGDARDYAEIVRKLRLQVRTWVKNSGITNALLRSLLPNQEASERAIASRGNSNTEAEGFGPRRAGVFGSDVVLWSTDAARAELETVREGALRLLAERGAGAATSEEAAEFKRAEARVRAVNFEILPTSEILAETTGETVRVSTGLLNEIHRRAVGAGAEASANPLIKMPPSELVVELRARVLGLIGGHELAHVSGQTSERAADLRGVEILERAHGPVTDDVIRESVGAFTRPLGASHVANFINRLKAFARYGTPGARVRAMERTARGEVDPMAAYRRADGTLDWKRVTGDRALREVGGLAHFGIALFLKELAVVAKSGDRARIEEFFDSLATTDFYKHYGLFVLGARAGEVAYVRYLERFIKPRFVGSILKTNLVLAAGLALPQLVEGNFSGKAFAISLGSLGLSTAAVRSGVAGIRWVHSLKSSRGVSAVGRIGRFAKVGGWFYTAAELAVILLVAEEIDEHLNRWIDTRAARKDLVAAEERFLEAANQANATPESLSAAAKRFHSAWTDYRDFLYRPLQEDEVLFAARLERAARTAKLAADRHDAAIKRIAKHPALLARTIERDGSLEGYADRLVAEANAELQKQIGTYADSYNAARDTHLEEIYDANRRDSSYLGGVDALSFVIAGAVPGTAGDPYANRTDVLARRGRDTLREGLHDALSSPSGNRLQAYEDELEVLNAVRASLKAKGLNDLAEALDDARYAVNKTRVLDDQLVHGADGGFITTLSKEGASGTLESALNDR
jgi:hypothetical protein